MNEMAHCHKMIRFLRVAVFFFFLIKQLRIKLDTQLLHDDDTRRGRREFLHLGRYSSWESKFIRVYPRGAHLQ